MGKEESKETPGCEGIRVKFGQNLKRLRGEKQLTVRGLALLSGLSKSTVENIEQARFSCSIDVAYKLSIGLGVSIRVLFDFTEKDETGHERV
jgi:transcriptional regulator with XRE-family HTH domain